MIWDSKPQCSNRSEPFGSISVQITPQAVVPFSSDQMAAAWIPMDELPSVASSMAPHLVAQLEELISLARQKLWFQLSEQLESFFLDPEHDPELTPALSIVFHSLVEANQDQLRHESIAAIALHLIDTFHTGGDDAEALQLIAAQKAQQCWRARPEFRLLFRAEAARLKLAAAQTTERRIRIRDRIAALRGECRANAALSPLVCRSVARAAMLLAKHVTHDAEEFVRAFTKFAAHSASVRVTTPPRTAARVTHDALAAVLGSDTIYDFAYVLEAPLVVDVAERAGGDELGRAVHNAFELACTVSAGDVRRARELPPPDGVDGAFVVRKAQRIAALRCVFDTPISGRSAIPIGHVLDAASVATPEDAEALVIELFARGLLAGRINSLDGTIDIARITPFHLDQQGLRSLQAQLAAFEQRVHAAAGALDDARVASTRTHRLRDLAE
eukprot:gnl/Chilomastix_cuspidata/1624.p1 GENE.gnl/Chilomastix_cuspidata/1624~~gnl/Chilomastix_cuspidata/1624.p1  ORF type:complete len:444 (+),score=225.20 gnl/Chilomastix_cuspidata/1624:879-2210(+)